LTSNDPNYVKHFYSIFEDLWNDGIDAADRIKDIEEGVDFADIEVIQNPKTAITRAWRLLKYAKEEVVILFSSTKAFQRQIQMGALRLLNEAATKYNVKVRILLPKSKGEISTSDLIVVDQTLKERETENVYPNQIDVRLVEESIPIRITIIVIDRKECMLIELKDDTQNDSFHAAGLSVYSNSKAIVLSYASIFESLWVQTETYEKLKTYSKMQTEFINNAAHELRTPIQPILAISEVLRFEEEKEERIVSKKELNKYLDVILTNARRLKDLGDNILNVSLIESRSLKLDKELFNLNDIIIDNVEAVKKQFLLIDNDNDNTSLEILYDKNSRATAAEVYLEADKRRISQVIYNLLHNAIKFTNDGSIIISVKRKVDDNKLIVVSINDTGKGIDSQIFPRLFSKFATKSEKGTGLGLFISKSIVEAHGGRIWAQNNRDGKGATFAFSLPLSK
jgi:two-component system sensor histidine kinase VicK